MAGHIQDRWYKTEPGPDGRSRRTKSERYGSGMRYRARYVGPDGAEKSRSFPDKQKRLAETWLAQIAADLTRGQYVDPAAGKVTFQMYATRWLRSQTTNVSTIDAIDQRFRLHIFPHIGSRSMSAFLPAHIREWESAARRRPRSLVSARHLRQRLVRIRGGSRRRRHRPEPLPCEFGTAAAGRYSKAQALARGARLCRPRGLSRRHTARWSTWALGAVCGKGRSSAWPSTRWTF